MFYTSSEQFIKSKEKNALGRCPGEVISYDSITLQKRTRMNTEDLKKKKEGAVYTNERVRKINAKVIWAAFYSLTASKHKFEEFSSKITKVSFSQVIYLGGKIFES